MFNTTFNYTQHILLFCIFLMVKVCIMYEDLLSSTPSQHLSHYHTLPYKQMGKSVYVRIGRTWRKKATASSVEKAKEMLILLRQPSKE